MPGGKVADVELGRGKPRDLSLLPFGKESLGDSALIENLDGACVQSAGTRAGKILAGAALDDGDVDLRQRELARQHQPRRAASGDHHRMPAHHRTPFGVTLVATGESHSSAAEAAVSNWAATHVAARRVCGDSRAH